MTAAERVGVAQEYDGNRRCRPLGGTGVDRAWRDDDIDLEPDQFVREFTHSFRLAVRPAVLEDDIPTLHVAKLPQALAEGFDGLGKHGRAVPEKADAANFAGRLRESSAKSRPHCQTGR